MASNQRVQKIYRRNGGNHYPASPSSPGGRKLKQSLSLVLASASTARCNILTDAGLDVIIDPANVDESASKRTHSDLNIAELAKELAALKATTVSQRHPGRVVIGADQTLECEGLSFDKPDNMTIARDNLLMLRGKTHTLNSAVCLAQDNTVLWSTVEAAHMTMRDFDDTFLDGYLDKAGEAVLSSVGCYRLEGLGAHLFSHIKGDFFTVLGLPLLPILSFLRDNKFLH